MRPILAGCPPAVQMGRQDAYDSAWSRSFGLLGERPPVHMALLKR
jgi:hypothetical protein